jgi:hypothetical protein
LSCVVNMVHGHSGLRRQACPPHLATLTSLSRCQSRPETGVGQSDRRRVTHVQGACGGPCVVRACLVLLWQCRALVDPVLLSPRPGDRKGPRGGPSEATEGAKGEGGIGMGQQSVALGLHVTSSVVFAMAVPCSEYCMAASCTSSPNSLSPLGWPWVAHRAESGGAPRSHGRCAINGGQAKGLASLASLAACRAPETQGDGNGFRGALTCGVQVRASASKCLHLPCCRECTAGTDRWGASLPAQLNAVVGTSAVSVGRGPVAEGLRRRESADHGRRLPTHIAPDHRPGPAASAAPPPSVRSSGSCGRTSLALTARTRAVGRGCGRS